MNGARASFGECPRGGFVLASLPVVWLGKIWLGNVTCPISPTYIRYGIVRYVDLSNEAFYVNFILA